MQSTQASSGWAWYVEGFGLLKKNFGILLLYFLILSGIGIFSLFLPLIGSFAFALLAPVLIAGIFYAIDQLAKDRPIDVGTLFQGFKDNTKTGPLIICGALLMAAQFVTGTISGGLIFGPAISSMGEDELMLNPQAILSYIGFFEITVILVLSALVVMGFMFAIPLIMLRNYAPVAAIKASFAASLRNIAPLLVFGAVYLVASIFAAIPFMLGFVFLIPLVFCATYASFNDIFSASLQA